MNRSRAGNQVGEGSRSCRRGGRFAGAVATAAALVLFLAAPVGASSRTALVSSFTLTGHGYGPGVGLSQWGAEERATAGQSHQQILSFYYPGTEISTAPATTIRVLLAEQSQLSVGSSAPFRVVSADGESSVFEAGHYTATSSGLGGRVFALPARIVPGDAPLMLGGNRYRGTFELETDGSQLQLVNALPLEQYVAEVVSVENPAYWPQEALRSQAIASRSYALANLRPGASFDVYSDNRSQNYRGLRKEYPSAVEAAKATSGRVLRYQGKIVTAFFTAANGGMTSNTDGIWGGGPLPYLAARPDPFDARSPDSNWGPMRVAMPSLRAAFPQIPAGVLEIKIATNSAQRITMVSFVGQDGSVYQIDGTTFQQHLGLRSTFAELSASYGS